MTTIRKNKEDNKMTLLTKPKHQDLFKDLVSEFFDSTLGSFQAHGLRLPLANVIDGDSNITIELQVPGLDKKDMEISVDNGKITIKHNHEMSNEQKDANYIRREFSQNSFTRTFSLPEAADVENIKSRMENGILQISIPKQILKQTTKRIEIQ